MASSSESLNDHGNVPNPNDHETISRDGVFKMNETQVQQQGETSSSSLDKQDQQFGGRGVYHDEQKEIEKAAVKNYTPKNSMEGMEESRREMEISEILKYMKKEMEEDAVSHRNVTKEVKIGKIPKNLRELHFEDVGPKIICIGPLHHGEEHLKAMEIHKWRLLSMTLTNMDNHGDQNQNDTSTPTAVLLESVVSQQQVEPVANTNFNKLRRLFAAMEELEHNARVFYSVSDSETKIYQLDSKWFIVMLLLEGAFIIQVLRLYAKCELEDVDDPIFRSRWMLPNLQRDLLLFENQLPFTAIEKIFEITSSANERYSLADLTINFFNDLLPRDKEALKRCKVENEPPHLLGLFRSSFLSSFKLDSTTSSVQQADCHPKQMMMNNSFLPSNVLDRKSSLLRTRRQQSNQQQFSTITINSYQVHERSLIGCATKLKEAGVVFKKREKGDLLDIKFKNGKLYIPPLLIDHHTGPVLLNFVAYEQCNKYCKPYFTQYLLFIECLLKSSKDVERLQSEGIIDHVLDSNEDVVILFHKLCKQIVHVIDDCYLSEPVLKHLNLFTQVKKHRRLAKLKEDYAEWKHDHFRSPWSFLSFFAAILLIVFTAIQTVFTVLAYVSPRS